MAGFTPLSSDDLFETWSVAYADAAKVPAGLDESSTVGAMGLATAKVGEQLDNQVETVANVARAGTSFGPDLDTYWQPQGIERIGAISASGSVMLGIASPAASPQSILPGYIVQTPTGVQYTVISSTLAAFNGSAYTIPAGSSSVTVAVQCLTAGSIGNALAGQISVPFSGPGSQTSVPVNSVTNTLAFTNGSDAETDVDFNKRATEEVSSGRVATTSAILAAIAKVRTGLTYQVGERVNPDGSAHVAHFTAVVDIKGTSTGPPTALLDEVKVALDGGTYAGRTYKSIRGAGITRDVVAPTEAPINVVAALKLESGAISANIIAAANAALGAYLNSFELSVNNDPTVVPYYEIIAVLNAVPGVKYPQAGVLVNGSAADISVAFAHRAVAGTFTVTTVA